MLVDEAKVHEGVPSVMLTNPVTPRFKGQNNPSEPASAGSAETTTWWMSCLSDQRVPDQSAGMKRLGLTSGRLISTGRGASQPLKPCYLLQQSQFSGFTAMIV